MLVSPRSYGKPFNLWVYHPVSQVSLKDGEKISFDEKTITSSRIFMLIQLYIELRFLNTENQKFTFSTTSEDEILKLLKYTNPENPAGIDNLSRRFLKDGAVILVLTTSKPCNLSMKHSKFPLDCKIAKLKPLYTKGSKTDSKNYCPISLLRLLSKVYF